MKNTLQVLMLWITIVAAPVVADDDSDSDSDSDGNATAGFMTSKGVTLLAGDDQLNITVWYPTKKKNAGPSEYVIDPDTPTEFSFPAGATRDARIKRGRFPLIVFNPGGGLGDVFRILDFPTVELLTRRLVLRKMECTRNLLVA